ncbi:cytochrome P450 [Streptomyces massasporeus]|uniref:cytochrome P450 n=1 Tax=Streptomyces massasporeus TaxID=67324 RepID=UPI00371D4705
MTTETPTDAVREPLPLADVDLSDLDRFTDGVTPWRIFHTLRREDPVHWQPEEAPNSGFWSLTRHEDIVRVDRDAETFTSTKFVNLEEVDDDQIKKRASILELDGVRHRALRSLIQRQFGANVINGSTDFLHGLTARPLDAALAKGRFDFVEDVSADFPINVLARLLDVPPEDNQRLIHWGNRIIGHTDPDYADVLLHSEESERYRDLPFRSPASLEVFEYGRELARQRRGGDGTDLVSRLVNTTPRDGVPLSPAGLRQLFLLLVAGPPPFDVARRDNDHVTFGKGSPHLCLGNLLARTEIRIMFEELIPRLADIRLAGDVPRVRSHFVNGIKKLPVEVTPA